MYSGSHNKVHVWRASEDFTVIKEIQTQYGTIYAMAVTKVYLIVGQWATTSMTIDCIIRVYFKTRNIQSKHSNHGCSESQSYKNAHWSYWNCYLFICHSLWSIHVQCIR